MLWRDVEKLAGVLLAPRALIARQKSIAIRCVAASAGLS